MNELISFDMALNISQKEMAKWHKDHLNPVLYELMSFIGQDKKFVRAEDVYLWDEDGHRYIDFIGGYGSINIGHNHPKVMSTLEKLKHTPNLQTLGVMAGALAKNLATITPGKLQRSFFCNSGAESIEGALKLARIATGKSHFISALNSFHGKTMGALSATGKEKYRKDFEPLIPGFSYFPYGNVEILEQMLKKGNTAAVILEPLQGEGGVNVPPGGFLKKARDLCTKYKAMLIVDEVQTGFGRTGKMFACEHEDVEPDIMCLAKSLGGGIYPIGAYITTDKIWQRAYGNYKNYILHTSTFSGNNFACAVALVAIEIIVEEDLVKKAEELGQYFLKKLCHLAEDFKLIHEVRGQGLFIGVEFKEITGLVDKLTLGILKKTLNECTSAVISAELLAKHKLLTISTLNNSNVMRIEPPLTITKSDIDYFVQALQDILSQNKNFSNLSFTAIKNVLNRKGSGNK
ncbi:aspartate aminotransferase family protein [Candidatus Uabimicrobium sp. HlEnr_7]|uniref:aspartate aminotransferase family protein n=1 Tax=Candidatus Uabimicrobium helgolandensis TaxID=3095367 RepID=UPI003555FFFA